MRKRWCKMFNIQLLNIEWKSIYLCKIKQVPGKKFAEFNYKLLNNLIIPGYILNKWNQNIPKTCSISQRNDTTEHMLFLCPRIRSIWEKVGEKLQIHISWKTIVLGLNENNNRNTARNVIFTIIAYCIYANWVKCHQPDSNTNFISINISQIVKSYLIINKMIFKNIVKNKSWYNSFNNYINAAIDAL